MTVPTRSAESGQVRLLLEEIARDFIPALSGASLGWTSANLTWETFPLY
ncbi:hypothetical protein JIR001_29080 [Polycladomyces abyssicola]|uniref:Uncharacterized protein n=1 Tax=Polycladomyces abyssicola TaxID=1125966 RepID=A0A8D5UJY8_9BACL|nr:hypothetical protein JIR001_29080 [Polycladomyces abyssicola]